MRNEYVAERKNVIQSIREIRLQLVLASEHYTRMSCPVGYYVTNYMRLRSKWPPYNNVRAVLHLNSGYYVAEWLCSRNEWIIRSEAA